MANKKRPQRQKSYKERKAIPRPGSIHEDRRTKRNRTRSAQKQSHMKEYE